MPKTALRVDDGQLSTGVPSATLPLLHLSAERRAAERLIMARKKRYTQEQYAELLAPYLTTCESLTHEHYVTEPDLDHRRILLLRHDIDHDYETALKIAVWEHARGLHATYCVLHSAWYYGGLEHGLYQHTDELVRLCHELHAMGHEINLHNNAVVVAMETGINPVQLLRDEIAFLRGLGLPLLGTSTHGDRICREKNFGNFELFAEAVKPDRGGPRIVRGAKASVQLGQISMSDLDLAYEAYDIARDVYISDSGGSLRCIRHAPGRRAFGRSDPASGEVIGILTHPIWWDFG